MVVSAPIHVFPDFHLSRISENCRLLLLCNELNEKILSNRGKRVLLLFTGYMCNIINRQRKYNSGYIGSTFKLMNLPVYSGTIFSSLCTNHNLASILNKNQIRSHDDGLLSEPTTEVNGNDP